MQISAEVKAMPVGGALDPPIKVSPNVEWALDLEVSDCLTYRPPYFPFSCSACILFHTASYLSFLSGPSWNPKPLAEGEEPEVPLAHE